MLILVGVTIATVVDGGLFAKAGEAATQTEAEKQNELKLSSGAVTIDGVPYNSIDEYKATLADGTTGGGTEQEPEEPKSPYIGCYVEIDGQYGVIYADLAYSRSGQWGNSDGAYSYEAEDEEDLKKYNENGTYDPGDEFGTAWGEKPLLVVDETQGGTIDRFYVMALSDFTANDYTTFMWDRDYSVIEVVTEDAFGTGADNTKLLIEYWEDNEDTTWTDQDIWKNLNHADGWFVPSRAEWSAFAQELGFTADGHNMRGGPYWSSSQFSATHAWMATLSGYCMFSATSFDLGVVRLSTTF